MSCRLVQKLLDGQVERSRIGAREPAHSVPAPADQKRWGSRESGVLCRPGIAGDLVGKLRVASVVAPAREVEARYLTRDAVEVRVGDVARVLLSLLRIEDLGEVPGSLLPARRQRRDLLGHE